LLAFSRKGKLVSVPTEIHNAIEDAMVILQSSIDKRILLKKELDAVNDIVLGDSSLIQNAVLNLGLNARDAIGKNEGTITVSTENVVLDQNFCEVNPFPLTPGGYICIHIKDTGCGISPELQGKIFEPFFTTKSVGRGTGLGLAAVYGSIKEHKGAITVYSEEGRGTIFSIYLPVCSEISYEAPDENQEIQHGSGCILIIEDEEIVRATAVNILFDLGYEIITATNGEDGLEAFKANISRIDLVLLDMVMPKMNGMDCFRKIKKISPDMKIILSSGFARNTDINQLFKEGLNDFIKKPYRRASLSTTIAKVLNIKNDKEKK
jgi:CheY-like chemotaxis protein